MNRCAQPSPVTPRQVPCGVKVERIRRYFYRCFLKILFDKSIILIYYIKMDDFDL